MAVTWGRWRRWAVVDVDHYGEHTVRVRDLAWPGSADLPLVRVAMGVGVSLALVAAVAGLVIGLGR